MLQRIALVLAGCCACSALAQEPPPAEPSAPTVPVVKKSWSRIKKGEPFVPMTGDERVQFLMRRLVLKPGAPLRAAFQAAMDQRANRQPAWGQGFDAYTQRFASRWGYSAVRNTIDSASAAALGYELRYMHCNCDGIARRTGHALAMYFVTLDRHGHRVPNIPRLGSTIAAQYIGLSWLPPGDRTAADITRGLPLKLLVGSSVNVWREFSPQVMRKLKSKLPGH